MKDIWTAAERYSRQAQTRCRPGGATHSERLPVTSRAYMLVYALDRALIGTPDYMGLAHWWADEYKHRLRGARNSQRRKAHHAILAAGLPLDAASDEHKAIINRATSSRPRAPKPAGAKK